MVSHTAMLTPYKARAVVALSRPDFKRRKLVLTHVFTQPLKFKAGFPLVSDNQ